jgi:hypothetical protein
MSMQAAVWPQHRRFVEEEPRQRSMMKKVINHGSCMDKLRTNCAASQRSIPELKQKHCTVSCPSTASALFLKFGGRVLVSLH